MTRVPALLNSFRWLHIPYHTVPIKNQDCTLSILYVVTIFRIGFGSVEITVNDQAQNDKRFIDLPSTQVEDMVYHVSSQGESIFIALMSRM